MTNWTAIPRTRQRCLLLLLCVVIPFIAALLTPRIQRARERARNLPYAALFGHGSANHFTYHLSAGGMPHDEYEKQVFHILENLVADLVQRDDEENKRGQNIYTTLFVRAPSLAGDCLEPLSGCTKGLDALSIENVQLSQSNVNAIGRATSLTSLTMKNAGLTASSLDRLAVLPNLGYLDVRDNGITAAAAHAFETAHPGCTIAW